MGLINHLKIIFMQFLIFGQQGLHRGRLLGLVCTAILGSKMKELGKGLSLTFVALCLSFPTT